MGIKIVKLNLIIIFAFFAASESSIAYEIENYTDSVIEESYRHNKIVPYLNKKKTRSISGKVIIYFKYSQFEGNSGSSRSTSYKSPDVLNKFIVNIEKSQSIVIDRLKIVTSPKKWNRVTGKYKMQVKLFKLFGKYNDIEEYVGDLELEGKLVQKSYDTFEFVGSAKKRYYSKTKDPLIEVSIGSKQSVVGF